MQSSQGHGEGGRIRPFTASLLALGVGACWCDASMIFHRGFEVPAIQNRVKTTTNDNIEPERNFSTPRPAPPLWSGAHQNTQP